MSRFRHKQKRGVPGLNLAAMPDLIFTVLFFFMIVTHMRDVSPKVHYEVPQGTEIDKGRKAGVVYMLIGKPIDAKGQPMAGPSRIQLNDRIVTVDQIAEEIQKERAQMSESDRQHLTVSIRADRDTEMGLINDVKQQLRKAGALNINYSATQKGKSEK
jgi:biopolymer transport protein ExbD